MGMTIDNLELFAKGLDCMGDTEHAKDIRQAIETMRKYQQIEEIYKEWFSDAGRTSADAYERIGEVIEDGKEKIQSKDL